MKKTGGCLCGQVRYETKADPMMTGVCHCKNCQSRRDRLFNLAAFQMADIEFSGDLALYEDSDTDTGNTVVFLRYLWIATVLTSPCTARHGLLKDRDLDDTEGFVAMFHCWSSTKQNWVELSPDVPAFHKIQRAKREYRSAQTNHIRPCFTGV